MENYNMQMEGYIDERILLELEFKDQVEFTKENRTRSHVRRNQEKTKTKVELSMLYLWVIEQGRSIWSLGCSRKVDYGI